MDVSTTAEAAEAFAALTDVAQAFAARGRRCLAATAKPALRARIPGFDETNLGYSTFRDFLLAAQKAQAIQLVIAGQDFQVVPPGGAPLATSSHDDGASAARPRIKRSLWQAIVDTRSGEEWLFDPERELIISRSAAPKENSLIPLPIVDEQQQNQWIEEFLKDGAGSHADELRRRLSLVSSLADRLRAMGAPRETRKAWYDFRTAKVTELLQTWKSEHGINVELFEAARPSDHTMRRRPAAPKRSRDDELRARLHRAIDLMPASELLRLCIPIEYVVDR